MYSPSHGHPYGSVHTCRSQRLAPYSFLLDKLELNGRFLAYRQLSTSPLNTVFRKPYLDLEAPDLVGPFA